MSNTHYLVFPSPSSSPQVSGCKWHFSKVFFKFFFWFTVNIEKWQSVTVMWPPLTVDCTELLVVFNRSLYVGDVCTPPPPRVSYFWHGCVVSQAAAQLVNINAVWRSDGDRSWHVVTLWWKALWDDVAGVFLLSAERLAVASVCVWVWVCLDTCGFLAWRALVIVCIVPPVFTPHHFMLCGFTSVSCFQREAVREHEFGESLHGCWLLVASLCLKAGGNHHQKIDEIVTSPLSGGMGLLWSPSKNDLQFFLWVWFFFFLNFIDFT